MSDLRVGIWNVQYLGPVELPGRTAKIVFQKGGSTNGHRPSDQR